MKLLKFYLITLALAYGLVLTALAAVDKRNGVTIRRDMTINGVTGPFSAINGQTIAATPTATATATSTATATVGDSDPPQLLTATVDESGLLLTLEWTEATTSTDFFAAFPEIVTSNDGGFVLIYNAGDGTSTTTFNINHGPIAATSGVCELSSVSDPTGVFDLFGNGFAAVVVFPVTNNSTQ